MTTNAMSPVTRINKALKSAGREERLVRGRGYYYLMGGEASGLPSSSIYVYRLEPTQEDFAYAAHEVSRLFAEGGIGLVIVGA